MQIAPARLDMGMSQVIQLLDQGKSDLGYHLWQVQHELLLDL